MSENRIRELTKDSFSKYTDLKYLYLYENMIMMVDTGTFAQLSYLEVIDLSSNALTTLPAELFRLSHLRTLYAADNNLFNLEGDLLVNYNYARDIFAPAYIFTNGFRPIPFQTLPKPIDAPLQIISLSLCKLKSIPDFGPLPST